MNKEQTRIGLLGCPPPPAYRIRDRELPQRLLGAILWIALFFILWKVGGR